MPITPLYGHDGLRDLLRDAHARGTLPSSLLLSGPRGVGKQRLALWLGQLLLCTGDESRPRPCGECQQCRFSRDLRHPDLQWYFPQPRPKNPDPSPEDVRQDYAEAIADRVRDGGLYPASEGSEGIYVATVRAIVKASGMSPAMARQKVFVIGDAERMVPQEGADAAANAFLKLLEEPPRETTMLITSSEPGALLPTIRSRVSMLRVPPVSEADVRRFLSDPLVRKHLAIGDSGAELDALARSAAGAPGTLLGGDAWTDALARARAMLHAALEGDAADRARVAFAQGGSRARGGYAQVLDALTVSLHEHARDATARGDWRSALGAARGVASVEWAKERVAGNVSPQLLSARILRDLTALLR